MSEIVTATQVGDILILDVDDGKANAVSFALLDELIPAVQSARDDARALVIAGRPGSFSAGFDLKVMGGEHTFALMGRGSQLLLELWELPIPLVYAVTGHALAMGAVLLCCADYRVAAGGPYKLGLNEIRINLPLPGFATELARARLHPAHLHRATLLAEIYDPEGAVGAGWVDEVVPAEDCRSRAIELATTWAAELSPGAFRASRTTLRGALSNELRTMLGLGLPGPAGAST